MNLLEYTEKAHETCEPQCFNEEYLTLGLISEVGELAGKMKRCIRENINIDNDETLQEIGDILWYASQILKLRGCVDSRELSNTLWPQGSLYNSILNINKFAFWFIQESIGVNKDNFIVELKNICMMLRSSLNEVANMNIKKLKSRKDRGVICGEGDNR